MVEQTWRSIAILKAKPGKEQELQDYTLEIMPKIRMVDGLRKVEVNQSRSDPGSFILYYWWESLAHLYRYVSGPKYAKILPKLKGLVQEHKLIVAELIDG